MPAKRWLKPLPALGPGNWQSSCLPARWPQPCDLAWSTGTLKCSGDAQSDQPGRGKWRSRKRISLASVQPSISGQITVSRRLIEEPSGKKFVDFTFRVEAEILCTTPWGAVDVFDGGLLPDPRDTDVA